MQKIIGFLRNIFTSFNNPKKLNEDLISFSIIQEYLTQPYYFPLTSSGLKFHTLAAILNDIILNKRECCLEFGSGISTLAISKLIKTNKLKFSFFSVEDDEEWYNFMKSFITKCKLDEQVNLIYAPLIKTEFAKENCPWYSVQVLNEKINNELQFDLVIVDGPGAWKPDKKLSRYAAYPFIKNRLAENYSVFLDDVNRRGEKKIISLWEKEFNIKFEKVNSTTAVYIKGSKSNIIL